MTKVIKIVKDLLWPRLNYRPNSGQVAVHRSLARNRLNTAGRRAGKSRCNGNELMPRAIEAYHLRRRLEQLDIRYEAWIVGPNYTDSEKIFRVFYNACRRLSMPFDRPGTYYNPKGDMTVSLWDGRFICSARSAAHPESLVGEGLHFAVMTEAAKMKEAAWERFIRPTLADFIGESVWDTTPEGKNWYYELHKKGQDPSETEWDSFRNPSWVNQYVFRKRTTQIGVDQMKMMLRHGGYSDADLRALDVDPEIISMAKDLTEEAFAQEVEASFSEHVGRVFKAWDDDVHVTDLAYNPSYPIWIATDYGYTDPNVALFIQVTPFGEINVLAEYHRTHRTDEEFANDVLQDARLGILVKYAQGLFPDPGDPAATATLSEKWRVPAMGGTGGELKDRLAAINKALKYRNPHLPFGHPERVPSLRFDRSCVETIREMDAYRWPEKRTELTRKKGPQRSSGQQGPERPLDKDDHGPEALGRWFAGMGLTEGSKTTMQPAQRRRRRASEQSGLSTADGRRVR
jgi:hypothetical protein